MKMKLKKCENFKSETFVISTLCEDREASKHIETAVNIIKNSRYGNLYFARIRASMLLGEYVFKGIVKYSEAYEALGAAVAAKTDNYRKSMSQIRDGIEAGIKGQADDLIDVK